MHELHKWMFNITVEYGENKLVSIISLQFTHPGLFLPLLSHSILSYKLYIPTADKTTLQPNRAIEKECDLLAS